jgi:hypothetical protein
VKRIGGMCVQCWAGWVGICIAYHDLIGHVLYRCGLVLCVACEGVRFCEEFCVVGDSFICAK